MASKIKSDWLKSDWFKSDISILIISRIGSLIVWLLLRSVRWQVLDRGGLRSLKKNKDAVIFVNWHNRLLGASEMLKHYPTKGVISPSTDGKLISGVVGPLGIETIWGSRSRNTVGAYREMRKCLKGGEHIGITPDGPRGPAREAAPGAIALAKASGARIIPIAWSTTGMFRLNTWDRFCVPKPFARGVQIWGKPIKVPARADDDAMEKARLDLEDALNTLTADADTHFGYQADHAEHRYGVGKEKR